MPSRSGFLVRSALAISSARAGSAMPGLSDDLDVGVVLLDRRLEGFVALVGHVVLRVVEDPGDLPLLAHRRGERVGGILAHREEVVGDDRDEVLALLVAGGRVGEEHDLGAGLDRRAEGFRRGGRVERQRQDDARLLGEHGLDVALLLGGIEAGVGGGDDADAEPLELVARSRRHRVHEIGRSVPEKGGGVLALLELGDFRVAELDLARRRRRLAIRPASLGKCSCRCQHGRDADGHSKLPSSSPMHVLPPVAG